MDEVFEPLQELKAYQNARMVLAAQHILARPDQSEEAFLGARLVLMINGLA